MCYVISVRKCICQLQIVCVYLTSGASSPDPLGLSPLGSGEFWGSPCRPPLPTLPPNPGHATDKFTSVMAKRLIEVQAGMWSRLETKSCGVGLALLHVVLAVFS